MTAGQLLSLKSTISNAPAIEHLKHIDCTSEPGERFIDALLVRRGKGGYRINRESPSYSIVNGRRLYVAKYEKSESVARGDTSKRIWRRL